MGNSSCWLVLPQIVKYVDFVFEVPLLSTPSK